MPALIAAAWRVWMRWPMIAQAAASYGDQKPTGRRPRYRRCSPAITGSLSPTAGNREPSTSSDKIRDLCTRGREQLPARCRGTDDLAFRAAWVLTHAHTDGLPGPFDGEGNLQRLPCRHGERRQGPQRT
jgi:hypothetical protein